jgi:D-tyrosyl-tRNA(Tyr) deacylase
MDLPRYVVILSDADPVARGVGEIWGTLPHAGPTVEGAPLRVVDKGVWALRRLRRHVLDDSLESRLPDTLRQARVPLIFPSIHRSRAGPRCFTVHPLGNLGDSAEVGGRPRTVNPTAPRLMAGALRAISEAARSQGLGASFEATHHGPSLTVPSFFVEIGGGPDPDSPSVPELQALARLLRGISEEPKDRVALGIGGGHYAPHFTDLALRRSWAFGHMVPRHALPSIDPMLARKLWEASPGAEGLLFARSGDADLPPWLAFGARLRDSDAPPRGDARAR